MTTRRTEILMADDDPDDRMLVRDALAETQLGANVRCVENGEDLLDYLHHRGRHADLAETPLPNLILLDLNMPKKDGREALREIKNDPVLRHVPIVVFTTSNAQDDIFQTYHLGGNSFIIKPASFADLVKIMKSLADYWFERVQLPAEKD